MRSLLVSLLTTLTLVGCSESTAPGGPLTLATTLAPSPLRAGDTATIIVSLTNPTLWPMHVGGSACPFTFDILDTSGAVVGGSAPQLCIAVLVSRVLSPGESVSQAFRWAAATSGGIPIQQGMYTVRGSCDWVKVRSSTTFVVLP